jgi:hypothetical protein
MSVRFEIALKDYKSFYGFGLGINVEPAHRGVGVCPTCSRLDLLVLDFMQPPLPAIVAAEPRLAGLPPE